MKIYWRDCIHDFIWKKAIAKVYSEEEVDLELESFWNHIISLIEYIGSNLFVDQAILLVIAEVVVEELEKILLPEKSSLVLSENQLLAVDLIRSLLLELLVCYGLSKSAVEEKDFWTRIIQIIKTQRKPTLELIALCKNLDSTIDEQKRKNITPFMTEDHFIRILKWRKKNLNDPEANTYLSQKLGMFESIMRT